MFLGYFRGSSASCAARFTFTILFFFLVCFEARRAFSPPRAPRARRSGKDKMSPSPSSALGRVLEHLQWRAATAPSIAGGFLVGHRKQDQVLDKTNENDDERPAEARSMVTSSVTSFLQLHKSEKKKEKEKQVFDMLGSTGGAALEPMLATVADSASPYVQKAGNLVTTGVSAAPNLPRAVSKMAADATEQAANKYEAGAGQAKALLGQTVLRRNNRVPASRMSKGRRLWEEWHRDGTKRVVCAVAVSMVQVHQEPNTANVNEEATGSDDARASDVLAFIQELMDPKSRHDLKISNSKDGDAFPTLDKLEMSQKKWPEDGDNHFPDPIIFPAFVHDADHVHTGKSRAGCTGPIVIARREESGWKAAIDGRSWGISVEDGPLQKADADCDGISPSTMQWEQWRSGRENQPQWTQTQGEQLWKDSASGDETESKHIRHYELLLWSDFVKDEQAVGGSSNFCEETVIGEHRLVQVGAVPTLAGGVTWREDSRTVTVAARNNEDQQTSSGSGEVEHGQSAPGVTITWKHERGYFITGPDPHRIREGKEGESQFTKFTCFKYNPPENGLKRSVTKPVYLVKEELLDPSATDTGTDGETDGRVVVGVKYWIAVKGGKEKDEPVSQPEQPVAGLLQPKPEPVPQTDQVQPTVVSASFISVKKGETDHAADGLKLNPTAHETETGTETRTNPKQSVVMV